jgi:hypothetical protein
MFNMFAGGAVSAWRSSRWHHAVYLGLDHRSAADHRVPALEKR